MKHEPEVLERSPDAVELRQRAERLYLEWARAWAAYQAAAVELEAYEERSREWVRTGMANGVRWPPGPEAIARWGK